jgi:hypothetical protein
VITFPGGARCNPNHKFIVGETVKKVNNFIDDN